MKYCLLHFYYKSTPLEHMTTELDCSQSTTFLFGIETMDIIRILISLVSFYRELWLQKIVLFIKAVWIPAGLVPYKKNSM